MAKVIMDRWYTCQVSRVCFHGKIISIWINLEPVKDLIIWDLCNMDIILRCMILTIKIIIKYNNICNQHKILRYPKIPPQLIPTYPNYKIWSLKSLKIQQKVWVQYQNP